MNAAIRLIIFNVLFLISVSSSSSSIVWECNKKSLLHSYLKSDAIIDAEIIGYFFREKELYLKVKPIKQFKDTASIIDVINYHHPSAYIDHINGLNWLDELIGKKYLFYLEWYNSQYNFTVCSRYKLNSDEKIHEEISIVKDLNKNVFGKFWIENKEFSEQDAAKPLTNIDSLLSTYINNIDSLTGYSVATTQFLINRYGRVIAHSKSYYDRFNISDFNRLTPQSYKEYKTQPSDVHDFFDLISSKITKWEPASLDSLKLNCLVTIKWELTEDNKIIYRIM